MDEPRFQSGIPNVTVAVGRDAHLPCIVESLGSYKVSLHFFTGCYPFILVRKESKCKETTDFIE